MLGYFCIGADGALVGYAALTPEPIVELFAAVEKGELKRAREISDRLFPLTRAIYSHPRLNWHTRIKEALVMLGEFESPRARPFLPALSVQEKETIRAVSTGLLTISHGRHRLIGQAFCHTGRQIVTFTLLRFQS